MQNVPEKEEACTETKEGCIHLSIDFQLFCLFCLKANTFDLFTLSSLSFTVLLPEQIVFVWRDRRLVLLFTGYQEFYEDKLSNIILMKMFL